MQTTPESERARACSGPGRPLRKAYAETGVTHASPVVVLQTTCDVSCPRQVAKERQAVDAGFGGRRGSPGAGYGFLEPLPASLERVQVLFIRELGSDLARILSAVAARAREEDRRVFEIQRMLLSNDVRGGGGGCCTVLSHYICSFSFFSLFFCCRFPFGT